MVDRSDEQAQSLQQQRLAALAVAMDQVAAVGSLSVVIGILSRAVVLDQATTDWAVAKLTKMAHSLAGAHDASTSTEDIADAASRNSSRST